MFDRYVDFSEQSDNNSRQGLCGVSVSWTCEHHDRRRAETMGGSEEQRLNPCIGRIETLQCLKDGYYSDGRPVDIRTD